MSDWNSLVQILTRIPGVIVWILLVSAAFLFHLRRPGAATIAQIGGSLIALLALCVSVFGQTLLQAELREASGPDAIRRWGSLLSSVFLVYQAGALVYAIALIASLCGLPRRDSE